MAYSLIIGLSGLLLLLLYPQATYLKSFGLSILAFALIGMVYLFVKRKNLLLVLRFDNENALTHTADYLALHKARWEQLTMHRLLIGLVLAMLSIALLCLWRHNILAYMITSTFITYLLLIIGIGWVNFNDQLLQQDIHHSNSDHSSA